MSSPLNRAGGDSGVPQSVCLEKIEELEYKNRQLLHEEAAFHNEREYYKDIFNNQPAGLYRLRVFRNKKWDAVNLKNNENNPYVLDFASDRYYEILGLSKSELLKNPSAFTRYLSDQDLKSFVKANVLANRKLHPFRWEGRLVIRNKVKWIRYESMPRKQKNGDVIWTGILYDITEWRQTEAELTQSRLQLEDILSGAKVGTLEWNVQTGKVKFNEMWARNLGYTLTEVKIGVAFMGAKGWKLLTHPDDIPYAEKMLERHFSGELPYHQVEVRMRHKSGKWLWIRQEGKVKTWTPDGKPLLMYGTHTDITARKEAELTLSRLNEELEERVVKRTAELEKLNAELKLAEQKFRTVADFSYTWEYWRGVDGNIVFMSPSVEMLTGYSIHEFENDPDLLTKIVYKPDLRIWEAHLGERRDCKLPDSSMEVAFRIVTKSGEIRWLGHLCRCITVGGENLGVRVSNRDITDSVAANNALLDITVKVEERERNRFSRELHDGLGPLLSTVKLYFDWLADTDDAEKRKMIIQKGGYCIETAIDTSRELARGMGSQMLIKMGFVIAIKQFVDRINDTNKIVILFESNTTERFNDFLETTLYRISTELIKNTLSYGQATKVEIGFRHDAQNNEIIFNYSDNGIGFDLAEIIDKGSGLGIMNIQQRVKVLRGSLKMDSKPGAGFKTSINIPVENS
ncbi:MAG: PAS domain-containing protein [Paludibacteraceae bacterium]|nr:PAS domain-containing protein [Paludibacteraceae bacterium]